MVRNLGELGLNLQRIISRLAANQNLLKLLYYTDKDPISQVDITDEQYKQDIYNKLILVTPYMPASVRDDATSKIALHVDNISPTTNDEFTQVVLVIEVFVPITQWIIKDVNLRPFAILSEINKSLNNKVVNGLGRIQNTEISIKFVTQEMTCYQSAYVITEYE